MVCCDSTLEGPLPSHVYRGGRGLSDSQGRWPQGPEKCLGEAAQEEGEQPGDSIAVSCSGHKLSAVRIQRMEVGSRGANE